MSIAEINIEINEKEVKEQLEKILLDYTRPRLLLCDINELQRLTCFKKAFLEEHIIPDPRVRKYQRQHGPRGKRIWIYEPTAKAILEIIDEW